MAIKKRIFAMICVVVLSASLFPLNIFANSDMTYIPFETNLDTLQMNDGSKSVLLDGARTSTSYSTVLAMTLENNLNIAADAYDAMMRSFYESQPSLSKTNTNEYTVNGITAAGFPEVFAGAYINKDLNLVVMMSEDITHSSRAISSGQNQLILAANTDNLIFSTATYSYRELVAAMDEVYQYIKSGNNGNEGFIITSFSLDDYGNRVVVGLEEISCSAILAFKQYVSACPAIDFIEKTTVNARDDASLSPGTRLSNGSIGFHIYKYENGQYVEGFVTTAHSYDPGDAVSLMSGTVVADAHNTAWQYGGNMDAVFCVMRNGNTFSNTLSYVGGTLQNGIDAKLSQGHPVLMVGATTQGEEGEVILTSHSYQINGTLFTDMVACDYDRSGGDSGAIVVSTRTGTNWIAGIHKGSDGTYSTFSKASNITTGLGLTFNSGS